MVLTCMCRKHLTCREALLFPLKAKLLLKEAAAWNDNLGRGLMCSQVSLS